MNKIKEIIAENLVKIPTSNKDKQPMYKYKMLYTKLSNEIVMPREDID